MLVGRASFAVASLLLLLDLVLLVDLVLKSEKKCSTVQRKLFPVWLWGWNNVKLVWQRFARQNHWIKFLPLRRRSAKSSQMPKRHKSNHFRHSQISDDYLGTAKSDKRLLEEMMNYGKCAPRRKWNKSSKRIMFALVKNFIYFAARNKAANANEFCFEKMSTRSTSFEVIIQLFLLKSEGLAREQRSRRKLGERCRAFRRILQRSSAWVAWVGPPKQVKQSQWSIYPDEITLAEERENTRAHQAAPENNRHSEGRVFPFDTNSGLQAFNLIHGNNRS